MSTVEGWHSQTSQLHPVETKTPQTNRQGCIYVSGSDRTTPGAPAPLSDYRIENLLNTIRDLDYDRHPPEDYLPPGITISLPTETTLSIGNIIVVPRRGLGNIAIKAAWSEEEDELHSISAHLQLVSFEQGDTSKENFYMVGDRRPEAPFWVLQTLLKVCDLNRTLTNRR